MIFFDDKPFGLDPPGFHIFKINPVVADKRVGHGDNLAGIRRIGKNFLVTGHGSVEDYLSPGLARPGKRAAGKHQAVFKCKECFHMVTCSLWTRI